MRAGILTYQKETRVALGAQMRKVRKNQGSCVYWINICEIIRNYVQALQKFRSSLLLEFWVISLTIAIGVITFFLFKEF